MYNCSGGKYINIPPLFVFQIVHDDLPPERFSHLVFDIDIFRHAC